MRTNYAEFQKANVGVFGVSVDSVYSHTAFAEHLGGLPYELIADFERRLVDSWGVRRTDLEGYDGVPRRTVFILDPDRRVHWRWITSPEQRLPDVVEVLSEAKKVVEKAGKKAVKKAVKKSVASPKPSRKAGSPAAPSPGRSVTKSSARKPR